MENDVDALEAVDYMLPGFASIDALSDEVLKTQIMKLLTPPNELKEM